MKLGDYSIYKSANGTINTLRTYAQRYAANMQAMVVLPGLVSLVDEFRSLPFLRKIPLMPELKAALSELTLLTGEVPPILTPEDETIINRLENRFSI
ncbi:hypothetical protein HYZ97_02300 [Candidatus Pacearchaeota archaeon]|nr:hypothetical protein [Candidatus Pacearchaeota archaeon]